MLKKKIVKWLKPAQKRIKVIRKFVLKNRAKSIAIVAGVIVVSLLAFPFRYLVMPALVNGQPIFSWQYLAALHKNAGQQVITQLINEALIEQEITKQNIMIAQADVDAEIKKIESQLGEGGSLDSLLSFQGLSRDAFIKNLRLNLALEKLVKSNIEVTDEEIQKELTSNPSAYKDLAELDAATSAAEAIRQQKLPEIFSKWFEELKAKASIKNFLFSL